MEVYVSGSYLLAVRSVSHQVDLSVAPLPHHPEEHIVLHHDPGLQSNPVYSLTRSTV